VSDVIRGLLQQPERIKAGLDQLIVEEDSGTQGGPRTGSRVLDMKNDRAGG
jgi:hypothetical protein